MAAFLGFLVHGSWDVPGCPEAGLDGSIYPGMGQAGVLASKVDEALWLEEVLQIVLKLVGCELGEGTQDQRVQRAVFDHRGRAHAPRRLLRHPVKDRQVLQDNIHHLVLPHGYEEERIIIQGVGGQRDTLAAGEAVAGVVDVARGPVDDGDPAPDSILLPKGLITGQNHLGSTGSAPSKARPPCLGRVVA